MSTFQKQHRFTRRSRRARAGLAACLLLGLPGGAVLASDCPTLEGDDLIIPDGCTYTITGAEFYEDVYVQSGGTLNVGAGGELYVMESVCVDSQGAFRFSASSGTRPRVIATDAGVMLMGAYAVTGSQGGEFGQIGAGRTFHLLSGSSITSGSGFVLISAPIENDGAITATSGTIAIIGAVTSGSTGTFSANGGDMALCGAVDNDGTITATSGDIAITGSLDHDGSMTAAGGDITLWAAVDSDGTITANGGDVTFSSGDLDNGGTITATGGTDVTFSGTISDWSVGLFQVTAADSDMIFSHTNTPSITGDADFNVEAGRMYFGQSLTTAGGYRQTGGVVEVAAGRTFTATGAY